MDVVVKNIVAKKGIPGLIGIILERFLEVNM